MTDHHPFSTARGIRLRKAKLRSVDWLCERCTAAGRVTEAVTVHHIVPLEDGGPSFPGLDGLLALCSDHHKQIHGSKPKVRVDARTGLPLPGSGHWWADE